ncbi:MAG TPA: hypothetical protein GX396_00635 [Tissierellia bacterium]|nr:hypothetical protein [Tissierellia bacterium]
MLRKYTCVNITIYQETNEEDYINGIGALPLIGLALGFFSFIIASLRYLFEGFFISSVVLLYYCLITKAVNIKDVYGTFNYYFNKEYCKDTWEVIILVIICLMYYSLFRIVPITSLILMPSVGFSCMIILSQIIKGDLSNTSVLKYCKKHHVIIAFSLSFIFAAILNYKLIISLSLTYMAAGIIVSRIDNKIKDYPVSIEGCIIELSQILFLIITYLFKF